MIVIRDIPELNMQELLSSLARIGDVQTGHGGFVVSERTAQTFLERYLSALDGTLITAEIPESEPEPETTAEPTKRRPGRPRKGAQL